MEIPELVTNLSEVKEQKIKKPHSAFTTDKKQTEKKIDVSVPINNEEPKKKIPLSLITGYLGSGKSKLLESIAKTSNMRLAVILNEFGDSSAIEKSVTIQDTENNESVEEWLDLGNGCLCCTVKDSGVQAIERLVDNSGYKIDHILLETTGIADPAPIAKMFWLDEGLASNIYIDGVITVLDAENVLKSLDDIGGHWHHANYHIKKSQAANVDDLTKEELEEERDRLEQGITTAHLQIALADVLLLNKIDKVRSRNKINEITNRVKAINSTSPIYETSFGNIGIDKILGLNAFEADTTKLQDSISFSDNVTYHDHRIKTVSVTFPFFRNELQYDQIESFLQYVLWENLVNGKPVEIHRVKGLLVKENPLSVKVVQGVRDTYDIIGGGHLIEGITENKIVFIGKGLNAKDLEDEMNKYVTL